MSEAARAAIVELMRQNRANRAAAIVNYAGEHPDLLAAHLASLDRAYARLAARIA